MKTIIGQSTEEYDRKTRKMVAKAAMVLFVVFCLNVLLTFLRDETNHNVLLCTNILLDIACVWGFMLYNALCIAPRKKLLKLLQQPMRELCGTVREIQKQTTRYTDFDCYAVQIDEEILYLIQDTMIHLQVNDYVKLQTAAGIIVGEVE